MNPPLRDPTTNDQQIILNWSRIVSNANTGGSAILSYGLEWDNGSNGAVWSGIDGYSLVELGTSFTVSTVQPGQVYNFKLQAKNIYGWGEFSQTLAVAAAGVPEQMSIPVTTNVGTDIVVTWQQPYDTSAPITAYSVFFRGADRNLYQNSLCVVTGTPIPTSCTVSITSLIASPFFLVLN